MAYQKDPYDKSIVINGWEKGIADSPFQGIANLRNINIISVPGEASPQFTTVSATLASVSGSMTDSSDANNTVTLGASITDGTVVVFTGASLPGGVSAATNYMLKQVTSTTYKLFTTYANYINGTNVNITSDSGTGTYVSVDMGKPTHGVSVSSASAGITYILDANGRVWTYTAPGPAIWMMNTTLSNANGNGLVVYRGYLFVFRNDKIDYTTTTAASTAWTYGWQTLNTASGTNNSHFALLGQDDNVYYCDGAYVGSFTQTAGATFDPSSSATYTWAQKALNLPSSETAQCLEELGTTLLVGGIYNYIYPWDRISTSFKYPILLAENFIWRMKTVNTNTYVLAGQRGRIYITNGSQASLFKKVPDHISGSVEPYFTWGGIASSRNQLYFGVKATTAGGVAVNQYGGIWAIDLDSQAIRLMNKLSYGSYAGLATMLVTDALIIANNPPFPTISGSGIGLLAGWDSGSSTYGIDRSSSSNYTSTEPTIDTDLIPIGTYDKPRDFTRIEYKLTRPLASGDSITIYYRLIFNTSDTGYTQVLADSTVGNYSLSGPINFKNAQWVQFQVVLSQNARLEEIRINGLTE